MKKNLLIPALACCALLALLFSACYKTDVNAGPGVTNHNHIPPDQTVIASLKGRVIDENGVPMAGASVVSGGLTTTTDVNGLFSFSNIQMSSRWGYVKVSKTGYYTGSRSIITNGAASNYVNIQMIPRVETGSFAASVGGAIVVQQGDTAAFSSNAVITAATNTAYTGTVHVFAKYLDPTDVNLYKYMPGDLRGIGTDGNETALQSFGMLLVELQGDAGEKLQLAAGHTAALTWAIPASLQTIAPATIPLWYFNDSSGRWIEQGSATRQGNSYVGSVSHFSYWNCDASSYTVNFKLHVKDQFGNPVAFAYVTFTSPTWGTRGGYTDTAGSTQGLIPKGQSLVMNVVTECGTVLGGVNVGPALNDQDLGTIVIHVPQTQLTLTGTVVDCSNNPVDTGYVNVAVDGLDYRASVVKGVFTLPIFRCYSTAVPITLTAADVTAQQVGTSTTVSETIGKVDVGQLSACGVTYSQFITLNINGSNYTITNPPDQFTYGYTMIEGNVGTANSQYIDLITTSNLTGTGVYPGNFVMSWPYTDYFGGNIQTNVTAFGAIGGYVTGTVTGNAMDSVTRQSYPMTGSFKVLRTK